MREDHPRGRPGRWPDRYGIVAPLYDVLSGEWPVYRPGRRLAVDLLALQPGEVVLDLGCGTGLNLPLLQARVGPGGTVIGLDRSRAMLRRARRRVRRHGWHNVTLVCADAAAVPPAQVVRLAGLVGSGGSDTDRRLDAVLATYALSLMPRWRDALATALALTGPGSRVAVVDLALPRGPVPWVVVARWACRLGGSDPARHPWTAVEHDLADVRGADLWDGHVRVRAGTVVTPCHRKIGFR